MDNVSLLDLDIIYDSRCTILVNSCDKYEEAWIPFFTLFRKFWKDCPFEVCLATETKVFDLLGCRTINTGSGSWTGRLNKALRSINTPYVIFLLEDFFFQAPVKTGKLLELLSYMFEDKNIGAFYFCKTEGYTTPSEKYKDFYDMNDPNKVIYHLNCQAALWNKSVFEKATSIEMDPWKFEMEGYGLLKDIIGDATFYCSSISFYDAVRDGDIFSYVVERESGYGIFGSKWLWNNEKLFKKHGIPFEMKTLRKVSHARFLWSKFGKIVSKILGPTYKYLFPIYKKIVK